MARVDLVVFDLAGTTVDDSGDAVLRCLVTAARAHGLPDDRVELNALMGMDKGEVFTLLARRTVAQNADPAPVAAAALESFRACMRDHYDGALAPIPGAEETFAYLRSTGVRVALDTGFDRPIAANIVDRLDWLGRCVDLLVSSSDVPRGRPAPYMIFRAMEATGCIDVRRVVKLGDSPADLEEGTNAGCGIVAGVLSGAHDRATLSRYPHTVLLPSVAELPAWLERTGA